MILIILLSLNPGKSIAQDTVLTVRTLRDLGVKFLEKGEYQLSYFYNYSCFLLEKDSVKKIDAALDAVDACLLTGHYPEAEKIIFDLDNSGSAITDMLKMKYGYSLLMQKDFTRANIYFSKIQDIGRFPNQYYFLKAYAYINTNQKKECLENLNMIDKSFTDYDELTAIKNVLTDAKKIKTKHLIIALPMSTLVPGLGQAYSGFYFDAVQSFAINAAFGAGAYAAWKYELTKDKDQRNYVLPSVSTLIFSVFYITNLFNTVNVTQKANLYSGNQYYKKIAECFELVLDRNEYFIRLKIKL